MNLDKMFQKNILNKFSDEIFYLILSLKFGRKPARLPETVNFFKLVAEKIVKIKAVAALVGTIQILLFSDDINSSIVYTNTTGVKTNVLYDSNVLY